jgi:nucleoside-diphosphate-sugar epimerase
MKILVTGASGMLGIEVCRAAVKRLGRENVVGLTHYDLDICDEGAVKLAHKRSLALGPYPEGLSALETERIYNERYIANPAMKVVQWWPDPWWHQYTVDMAGVTP